MSIRNKTKGVKMKSKVALAVVAVLGVFFIQPAEANPGKSLVIIDAYFQSGVAQGAISSTGSICTQVTPVAGASASDPYNHGTAVYSTAVKQNPNIKIIPICAGTVSVAGRGVLRAGSVTPDNFINALNWVNNNSSNVGAVSVSVFMNHNTKPCMPPKLISASPETADTAIRGLIATLKSKNIPVFVATGNAPKTKVDYPACITDTVSVTSPGNVSDASTDLSVSLDNNAGVWNFNSTVFGSIPQTTSTVTSAVAAQYILNGMPTTKVVTVNP